MVTGPGSQNATLRLTCTNEGAATLPGMRARLADAVITVARWAARRLDPCVVDVHPVRVLPMKRTSGRVLCTDPCVPYSTVRIAPARR